KVVFCFSFTAGGLKTEVKNGKLKIIEEGKYKKFINKIDQVTFSAKEAVRRNQKVLFITERAVFDLTEEGLRLIEIAPGIDLQKDVLNQMEIQPLMNKEVKVMDPNIFTDNSLDLQRKIHSKSIL